MTEVMEKKKKQDILMARAKHLSALKDKERSIAPHVDVVVFQLAEELFALEPGYVVEVTSLKDVTILPGVPKFIYGIINVRRKIVSVVNLKECFDLPPHASSPKNRVLVLKNNVMEFGILADAIVGIQKVPISDIQSDIPTLSGIRQEFLKGVTPNGIVLLDGEKLLSSKHLVVDIAN